MKIKKFSPIVWVLFIAFAIRLLLPLSAFILTKDLAIFYGGDTISYLKPATELIRSGRFTSDGFPELFRAPGYSLMLVPGLILGQVELVTVAWQIIVSCVTVYLVYKLSNLIFSNDKVPVICAWLYALEPLSIVYPGKLLTETVFTCLIFAFLYVFIKYLDKQTFTWLLAAAIILSVSAYTRPIAYYLPFLFALILIIFGLTKFQNRQKLILVHAFLFFSISMGSLYLWNLRNKAITGHAGFSSVTEINLYYWHAGALLSAKKQSSFDTEKNQLLERLKQEVPVEALTAKNSSHLCNCEPEHGSPIILNYMREQAKKILLAHPLTYFNLRFNGALNLMFNSTPWPYLTLFNIYKIGGFAEIANAYMTEFYTKGWLAGMAYYWNQAPAPVRFTWLILQVNLVVYMFLALVGILSKNFFKPTPAIMMMVLGVYFLIITSGPEGASSRYRHPIMPIICILAGYGLHFLVEKFRAKITQKPVTHTKQ